MSLVKRVLDNLDGNFKLNEQDERRKYHGAVQGFFKAETTHDRIDHLVKSEFHRIGTQLRMAYNGIDKLPYSKEPEKLMVTLLLEEIPKGIFDEVIRKAEDILCDSIEDNTILMSGHKIKEMYEELSKAYYRRQDSLMDETE